MAKKNLQIFEVSNDYIAHLQQVDKKVMNNIKTSSLRRPYIGPVFNFNGLNYYVPVSSPDLTDYIHLPDGTKSIRYSITPILRICKDSSDFSGFIGKLLFGNMIPVPESEINLRDLSNSNNQHLISMYQKQLVFIRKNKELILKHAKQMYYEKKANMHFTYVGNAVDFGNLEIACVEFNRLKMEEIRKKNILANRKKYIGGSDLPIILGYNEKYGPDKSVYAFARIKAGIDESTFKGNPYTKYGHLLEPKVVEYMNERLNRNFKPEIIVDEEKLLRSKCDGISRGANSTVLLEVKTYGSEEFPYEQYIPQTQMYMEMFDVDTCFLVGYKRPDDFYTGKSYETDQCDEFFNTEFDSSRVTIKVIDRDKDLWYEIYDQVLNFQECVLALKKQPDMTKDEFDKLFYGSGPEIELTKPIDFNIT